MLYQLGVVLHKGKYDPDVFHLKKKKSLQFLLPDLNLNSTQPNSVSMCAENLLCGWRSPRFPGDAKIEEAQGTLKRLKDLGGGEVR